MSSLSTRLDRLRLAFARRPAPPPAPPSFDPTRLTLREMAELDDLLARVGRRPNGHADFGALSDDELARLDDLDGRCLGAPLGAA